MNIRCPHCQTIFRVNPDRIPAGGVRAKCARCGDTFLVTRPPLAGGRAAAGQQPAEPAQVTESVADPSRTAPFVADPAFGMRDPMQKAERLARALVSDIVAYHPERLARSYESGSLRTEFRDEIMKSWEEYVAQVGLDLAKSTRYFRDALNHILAKGRKVF